MNKEQKAKIAESVRRHWQRVKGSDYYKQRCKKMSEANKGRKSYRKGKTLEEIFGKERAKEVKKNMYKFPKGNIPWNKGKKPTPKMLKQLKKHWFQKGNQVNLGRKRPDMVGNKYRVGIKPWCTGKKCPQLSGKNHWNWHGGINRDGHSTEFKTKLSKQYLGIECEACKSTNDLLVHHKDFNKLNDEPDNFQTICRRCHARWHHMITKAMRIAW